MKFTYTEKFGQKPISEWYVKHLKLFAEKEYGIKLKVKIEEKSETKTISSN